MISMPSQVRLVGPIVAFPGKLELPSSKSFKQECLFACFVEAIGGNNNPVVLVKRPQACIEHPVGILAEREPILRMIVTAIGKLVDVCRIHDAAGSRGNSTVAGQSARVIVRRHDGEAKARFASALLRL